MSMFKCKMCGGSLEVTEGMTVCECEYCGTSQTLPKSGNEQTLNMINRANHFRQQCEFDKALEIYERLISSADSDAEIYWSLVLCRYGIEYVNDPLTKKKIPTCHRTQFKSILDDADYQQALSLADSQQKELYQSEAQYIDSVQKGILEISNKEEPFDVFICYKESDENGKRTPDSVLAQELYYQLEREGFKVFFSRITLEGKLGTAYEPYIFAALNSSKVMVVVGTKPEYFNAVWVKNEWSRYLMLMQEDKSRTLIPAYRDMDPYDLPDALSMFQAQDMSKLGFMQDLIHGIRKIAKDEPAPQVVQQVVQQSAPASSNAENLLKRGNLALEDKKWVEADGFFEQVLNENAEESRAYLGKLLVEYKVSNEKQLENCTENFSNSDNYKKAVRFGYKKLEETYKQSVYNKALTKMKNADNDSKYREAKSIFLSIKGFKDAEKQAQECEEKALAYLYDAALKIMNISSNEIEFSSAKEKFKALGDYKDSKQKAKECENLASEKKKEVIYNKALSLQNTSIIKNLEEAISIYEEISDYKDSKKQIENCQTKILEINEKDKREEKERQRIKELSEAEKKRISKRNKKIAIISSAVAAVGVAAVILVTNVIIPTIKYNDAMKLYNSGKYEEAISAFAEMDGYKNSDEMISKAYAEIDEINYQEALSLYNNGKYEEAISAFEAMNGYKDSVDMVSECKYSKAIDLYNSEKYEEAISIFGELNSYKNSYKYRINSELYSSDIGDRVQIGEEYWFIIDKSENKYKLLNAAQVYLSSYNEEYENITWENCSLRSWLNDSYYNSLSEELKSIIVKTNCSNPDNSKNGTDGGNDTEDYIFLLSIEETADLSMEIRESGYIYWLRSPGSYSNKAAVILNDGSISKIGHDVYKKYGVRPAIWIDLYSLS